VYETHLPSPHQLTRKILLKGKMLRRIDVMYSHDNMELSRAIQNIDQEDQVLGDLPPEPEAPVSGPEPATEKISEALAKLTYLKSVAFKNPYQPNEPWEMSSFEERKIQSVCHGDPEGMMKYNGRLFSRIYPAGTRFSSTNYNPISAWMHGSQMVALNYQKLDNGMIHNQAMFQLQGGCGYVIKPSHLREDGDMVSSPLSFSVTIISARQLPKRKKGNVASPYVELEILGIPQDCKTEKTKFIKRDGYKPTFNEKFSFRSAESFVACLVFRVVDQEEGSLIAYYPIMVNALRPGYRIVNLWDPRGKLIPCATLFCHVEIHNENSN